MKLVVDGRAAYAYSGGKAFDPAQRTVVFVHGALHDHSAWTLLARWCAHHGWSVLAVDLPGHGRSAGPPLPDVETAAAWLLALLQAANVERVRIAGHSMGSLIALETAAQAGGRVDALALIATAYPMRVGEALLGTAHTAPLEAIDMVNGWSLASTASKPSYPGPGMWLHGANRQLMRRNQAAAAARDGVNLFVHDFGVCDRYARGLDAAAAVCCPVTLVLGDRDQMTPPKATQALAAALRARVVRLASGHTLMSEAPDALLAALRDGDPAFFG